MKEIFLVFIIFVTVTSILTEATLFQHQEILKKHEM